MSGGFCPQCGAAAAADAKFCAACGKPLGKPAAPAAAAPAPPGGASSSAPEKTVFELRPLTVRTVFECFASVVTLGVVWVCLWIARMGLRYRVTTERIETRQGIVTIQSRFVDLFRIEDFELREPFFLRMRGAGDLVIRSMDEDQPIAALEAIPNVREVYETLRKLANDERAKKRVRVVEDER
jgi:membrane protein YdbS with pleckstrin-like domain